ncbi:transcriptional regulator [Saliphagus sp. GCM10025317]
MDPRTQERVERWDSRPFSGGYDGLSSLADEEFSGAVTSGGAWAFMLNGRIVGVVDGALEQFDGASGTTYVAPHPSLPLLCTMDEQGGETRAKYYTNDTPLSEVDQTLQEGSFTGYIELSEQVLSGDYYLVYYGGRRMAAAYIGNAQRLLTGDEAFERADDEVGIYEVVDVDIDIHDVPGSAPATEPTSGSSTTPAGGSGAASGAAGASSPSTDGERDVETQSEPASEGTNDTPGGITTSATTEPDPEPVESSGITEPATEADARADDDPTVERDEVDEHDGLEDAETVDDGSTADAQPMPPAGGESRSDASGESDRGDDDAPGTPTDAGPNAATPVEDAEPMPPASSESPDPEEVEAAAEELGADGVPWEGVDEDDGGAEAREAHEAREAREVQDGNEREADDRAPETDNESSESDPLDERFKQEEQWRETRNIPSIDPKKSSRPDRMDEDGSRSKSNAGGRRRTASGQSRQTGSTTTSSAAGGASSTQASNSSKDRSKPQRDGTPSGSGQGRARSNASTTRNVPREALEEDMLEREDKIDRLTQRVDELEREKGTLEERQQELATERDRYRERAEELSATVDRLQQRIETLETELERIRAADAAGVPVDGTSLSPQEALSRTNLFVRYASKSQPTLTTAHDENVSREDVAENLRLEHHTQFDASEVVVDGQSYEAFLGSRIEYQFVEWLVATLPFEIRDTGHADGLGELYDALPRIDRAELDASVSLDGDDTEGVPDEVAFDVVAFDKMGNPLLAANLDGSRDPATQTDLETLEESVSAVKANHGELAAAFFVTSSFFEPGALEVTEQATGGGGFLTRDSRLSYVSLSRKQGGYHLCLVESRSGGFHMNVPEL